MPQRRLKQWSLIANFKIHYRQKYGIFGNHNGNARVWNFDLLETACSGHKVCGPRSEGVGHGSMAAAHCPWRHFYQTHDDVIEWKHFPRSPVNSPHKGQWRGALMFSFIYVGTNGWVNNSKAGDLKRYRAHYDVIVMKWNDGIPNQCDSNGLKKSICVWHGNNNCLNVDWYIACQLNWYTFRDMQKYCQRHHSQNQSYIDIFVSHSI